MNEINPFDAEFLKPVDQKKEIVSNVSILDEYEKFRKATPEKYTSFKDFKEMRDELIISAGPETLLEQRERVVAELKSMTPEEKQKRQSLMKSEDYSEIELSVTEDFNDLDNKLPIQTKIVTPAPDYRDKMPKGLRESQIRNGVGVERVDFIRGDDDTIKTVPNENGKWEIISGVSNSGKTEIGHHCVIDPYKFDHSVESSVIIARDEEKVIGIYKRRPDNQKDFMDEVKKATEFYETHIREENPNPEELKIPFPKLVIEMLTLEDVFYSEPPNLNDKELEALVQEKSPQEVIDAFKKTGIHFYESPKPEHAIIAIDPGASGALCIITDSGLVYTHKMPDTPKDLFELLKSIDNTYNHFVTCYMEKVQGLPGMGGSPMFNFGKGYGHLEMALLALDIKTVTTRPQEWQKTFGIGTKGKSSTTEWKNKLKAKAQQLFPSVKVTLANADALLIGEWARNLKHK